MSCRMQLVKTFYRIFLSLCTSHTLWLNTPLVSAQYSVFTETENVTESYVNPTDKENQNKPVPHPSPSRFKNSIPTTCNCGDVGVKGAAVLGAVALALFAGIVIGAVVMFFVQKFLFGRNPSIPHKDYNESQSSALDVNMNNGERSQNSTGESDAAEEVSEVTAEPQVKGHKKLERLSKQGQRPIVPPKPLFGREAKPDDKYSVAAPLIYTGPKSNDGDDKGEASNQPGGGGARRRNTDSGIGGDDEDDGELYENENYTNIGLDAALSQPYESLAAIPEEVEYANTQQYEQIGLVST